MKVVIDVNKDTSKLLIDFVNKLKSTKIGDLDKSRSRFNSTINELERQLADTPEKEELINFLKEVVDDDEKLVTIDEDPNIIDNKTLININTRKMNKKDLIKQELGEIESILKSKAYSQLLAKYHARLFSDVEGLEGEDIQEIKDRLDNISDQLEEISNSETVSDESVEVTDEVTETEEGAPTETDTAEVTEEGTEGAEETSEESTEESTKESTEETTQEVSEEEVKTESDDETEVTEESTEEVTEETTEGSEDKTEIEEYISKVDEALEELKEAVETKDFSKVIARHYDRLFSAVEEHQDLIENIDEVKSAMDDLAEKIEKLDAEADEDESDKHEGEKKEVEDAEKAEEESDDAREEEAEMKTESKKCGLTVYFEDGTSTHYDSEDEFKEDQERGLPAVDHKEYDKCMSEEGEVVTDEQVEETTTTPTETEVTEVATEIPSTQEVEAIAEQAAEEAVNEYMQNELFLNEPSEDMSGTEALVSPEIPEKESQVDPMFLDEDNAVLDVTGEEVITESEDNRDEYEDAELYYGGDDEAEEAEFCNRTFSKNGFVTVKNTKDYELASIEDLLGI